VLGDVTTFARYARGLRRFLGHPLTPLECRRMVADQLSAREASFLRVLERAVFASPRSPYRRLLEHAGIELGDIARAVRQDGIEATLETLYAKGVYVTLEQFKGRRAIERPGLSLPVRPGDFDNPLLARHFEVTTGGSRGAGRRVMVDLDLLTHEAAYHAIFSDAFGLGGRPEALWFPPPPAVAGIKQLLRRARAGAPAVRWFAQSKLALRRGTARYVAFTWCAIGASRLLGRPLPAPEHVPPERAFVVAEWLAGQRRQGTPAVLAAGPSSVVRVCTAAGERGLDISGTFFRTAGEPYTPAKARIVAGAGCSAGSCYSMAEIGSLGMGCATPAAVDDVHLLTDKMAVIQRERAVGPGGMTVGALFYTTLLPSCPKLMLNVESDDYGVVAERPCGCPFGELGFRQHLHGIRSYDKLTSEAMSFLGSELIALVEEVLPARFGGSATDYQLVEEEVEGLPKIDVVVSLRIGAVDERQVVEAVLEALGSDRPAHRMMAELWRGAGALRVVRREPYTTGAAKVLPLHILRNARASAGADGRGQRPE
jgi:hypothetical protein